MRRLLLAVMALALLPGVAMAQNTIDGSPHDLGTGGAYGTDQVCIFCHTPHNPELTVPLWNHNFHNLRSMLNHLFALYTELHHNQDFQYQKLSRCKFLKLVQTRLTNCNRSGGRYFQFLPSRRHRLKL